MIARHMRCPGVVRPSVTSRSSTSIKTAKCRITQTTLHIIIIIAIKLVKIHDANASSIENLVFDAKDRDETRIKSSPTEVQNAGRIG